MQTKQQERAKYALEAIESLMEGNGKLSKELATFIVGMPNMILSNGLGQTMAFLLSKGGGKYRQVYESMKGWLVENKNISNKGSDIAFLTQFNEIDQAAYLKAQRETLRFLEWFKRYARAFEG